VTYRTIDTRFWTDPKVRALSDEAKLVFIYLITNPHTHASGIYYLPRMFISHETGLSATKVSNALDTLSKGHLALYDDTVEGIWVVNMLRYQGRGPKIKAAAESQLATFHKSFLVAEFLSHYEDLDLSVPYPLDTPSSRAREEEYEEEEEEQKEDEEKATDLSRSAAPKHDGVAAKVAEVVAYYQGHHPRARPGQKERTKIRQRLAEGFTVDDLRDAIDGCHASPWHCGDNKDGRTYQNLELIMRDATKAQQFIELKAKAGNAMLGERLSKTKTNLEAWGEEMARGTERVSDGNGTARVELRAGDPGSDHRRLLEGPQGCGDGGLGAGDRDDLPDREEVADPGGDPQAR